MSDTTLDKTNEKLSAFFDDELASEQLPGLGQLLADDEQLRGKLSRYALISESLKGNDIKLDASHIVVNVHEALEKEPALMAPNALLSDKSSHQANAGQARKAGLWKTYVGGGAIAATVAMFTLMNFDAINPNVSDERFPVTVELDSSVKPIINNGVNPWTNSMAQPASTQWYTRQSVTQGSPAYQISQRSQYSQQASQPSKDLETELNQFLIEHSEYTNQAGMPGLVPYATFVVYDKDAK